MCAQFLGRDSEELIPFAHRHKMTGSLNRMPYRSWHSVSDRLVDGIGYESIIGSLPHVDWPFDCCHVESPAPIKEFSIADQQSKICRS
jgi:hypothetical protein